jgi:hypothetical protein
MCSVYGQHSAVRNSTSLEWSAYEVCGAASVDGDELMLVTMLLLGSIVDEESECAFEVSGMA